MTESENSFSVYSSGDEEEANNLYQQDPKLIAKLYCEIKEKKILNLDWNCAGRFTPAEYEQEFKTDNGEMEKENNENDSKDNSEFNDFDFDEDPMDSNLTKESLLLKKKSTTVPKKVTNLDKVIGDIKKYQKIEKQTKLSTDDDKM